MLYYDSKTLRANEAGIHHEYQTHENARYWIVFHRSNSRTCYGFCDLGKHGGRGVNLPILLVGGIETSPQPGIFELCMHCMEKRQ